MIVGVLVLWLALFGAAPPEPAPAPSSSIETEARRISGGGQVDLAIELRQRSNRTNDDSDGDGRPVNLAEVAWNSWCGEFGPYAPGATVGERREMDTDLAAGASVLDSAGYEQDELVDQIADRAEEQQIVYFEVECYNAGGELNIAIVPRGPGGGPVVDPLALRNAARARIEPPEPDLGTNPPFGERGAVVQLPTWLWVENPWEPITATESLSGVTVSVTATPQTMTWNMGDGNTVICRGPGVVWQPGLPEDATDCSHTYRSSTADEPGLVYTGDASVTWEFTWTLNGAPQGAFGSIDTAADFAIEVGEIHAISTGG